MDKKCLLSSIVLYVNYTKHTLQKHGRRHVRRPEADHFKDHDDAVTSSLTDKMSHCERTKKLKQNREGKTNSEGDHV